MAPVAVPQIKRGDDPRERLSATRGALFEANDRLRASAGWYESVRETYRLPAR